MTKIKDNLKRVQEDIARVCKDIGRDSKEITIVGVTKFAPVEFIQDAVDCGLTDIAENKVQEGQKKYPLIKNTSGKLTRHLIGHLQTNKVKDAIKVFDLIQSVDSLNLAQEIEKQTLKASRIMDILFQVNTSGETQKFGSGKEDALSVLDSISKLKNIRILGLMAMAPLTEDEKIIHEAFRSLREIRDEAVKQFNGLSNIDLKYLSMGMSGDYRIALEEGSNMVRIGRAIFALSPEEAHA